ncbi:MAG: hypothetical protein IPQ07_13295 [Myxococcales bacterium]|nr:hypothetical protein [Myxococcales bacterium]
MEGASGCTGDWIHSVFEVASDGAVIWSAEDMAPRRLQLTREELAVITGMNSFDCVRTERIGYSSSWLRISPGGGEHRAHGGAVISQSSMLGILVDGVLSQAIDRYRRQRLAALRPFEMHLTTTGANGRTRYHLDLDGEGQLTVRLRGRELIGRPARGRRGGRPPRSPARAAPRDSGSGGSASVGRADLRGRAPTGVDLALGSVRRIDPVADVRRCGRESGY